MKFFNFINTNYKFFFFIDESKARVWATLPLGWPCQKRLRIKNEPRTSTDQKPLIVFTEE